MRYPMIAVVLLAACAPDKDAPPAMVDAAAADACGASGMSELSGQQISTVDLDAFDGPVRVVQPDSAVTMDFRADRLNFTTDDSGIIIRIWCG